MEAYDYYYRRFLKRLRAFNFLAVGLYILLWITSFPKHIANGVYDIPEVIKISIGYFLIFFLTNIVIKLIGKFAFKNLQCTIIAIVLTFPIGLYFYWPILMYHNSDGDVDYEKDKKYDNKVLKATIKAYQQAWKRQNFVKRIIVPLGYLAIAVVVFYLISYALEVESGVISVAFIILLVLAYALSIALLGGFTDVRRTYIDYDVSIGKGWFDYGEVYINETNRKTKDETDVSILSMILAIPLTPVVIMAALVGICAFIAINLLRIVIHSNSMYSIYMHKKTTVHPYYALGPKFLAKPMTLLNRLLRILFGINLVNKDFWFEGIGTNYITTYLNDKNRKYLQKKLEKVEKKYGYIYYF